MALLRFNARLRFLNQAKRPRAYSLISRSFHDARNTSLYLTQFAVARELLHQFKLKGKPLTMALKTSEKLERLLYG